MQKLIIGNKCDLDELRQVSFEEGEKMAEKLSEGGSKVEFMEVSAKTGYNVEIAFMKICEQVKESHEANEMYASSGKSSVMRISPLMMDEEKPRCQC